MQVSKATMEPILINHLEQANDGGNSEWKFSFLPDNGKWPASVFRQVLGELQANPDYKEKISMEKLYITPAESENSLVVEGMPHISLYCLNESPLVVPHTVVSKHVKTSKDLPDEFPVNINSSVITATTGSELDYTTWDSIYKHYKIVKEFAYKNTSTNTTFKVLITRQSEDANSLMMKSSGVSAAPMLYEFEMYTDVKIDEKILNNEEERISYIDEKINQVMNNCMIMIQMLTQQKYPLSRKQQYEVAEEYNNLIKPHIEIPRWQKYETKKNAIANASAAAAESDSLVAEDVNAAQISNFHFLAPKPITLEQMHMVEPGPDTYGVQSILKGYAVTDKADGERMLMYINKKGHAYLINNTFDVRFTGLVTQKAELFASVLDGEFISSSQRQTNGGGADADADENAETKNKLDIFAVFDIYFQNGKKTTDLPLITMNPESTIVTRYSLMMDSCRHDYWRENKDIKHQIELRCKAHIPGDGHELLNACKSLLYGARKLPYTIDGLIFTPRDLTVYGYYPGVPVPIPENAKWERVMKWKPAEQNTIDFLIKEIPNSMRTDPVTRKVYKKFKLYTGYNAAQWEPITPLEGVKLRYDKSYAYGKKKMAQVYRAKEFRPFSNAGPGVEIAELEVKDAKGNCICIDDKSVVNSDTIVEFAFDKDTPTITHISRRWIPLRLREDKTRIYQKKNTLSKTANDLSVATSIWRAIHNPVTRSHITGVEIIPASAMPSALEERILGVDDVYYARDVPRNHLLSVHMLDFHNQGIKKMLYTKCQNRDSLIEFACGMAGDLPRWRDSCYRFVMGVDLSRDNIVNPRDGAYARMLKQKYALSAENVKNCNDGIDGRPVYMDTVFLVGDCAKPLHNATASGDDEESIKLLKILYNKPTRNVEPFLNKLVGRASRGFSMASCMFAIHYFFYNEEKLDGFLNNVSNNLKQGGTFICTYMDGQSVDKLLHSTPEIVKRGFAEGRKLNNEIPVWSIIKRYNTFTREDSYGKHVDVFLENTNKLIPEFLVYFDLLVEKAAAHGLELSEDGMFHDTFNEVLARASKLTPNKYSHLEEAVMKMKDDKVQTQFSFLNRWTVFKKV